MTVDEKQAREQEVVRRLIERRWGAEQVRSARVESLDTDPPDVIVKSGDEVIASVECTQVFAGHDSDLDQQWGIRLRFMREWKARGAPVADFTFSFGALVKFKQQPKLYRRAVDHVLSSNWRDAAKIGGEPIAAIGAKSIRAVAVGSGGVSGPGRCFAGTRLSDLLDSVLATKAAGLSRWSSREGERWIVIELSRTWSLSDWEMFGDGVHVPPGIDRVFLVDSIYKMSSNPHEPGYIEIFSSSECEVGLD